MRIEICQKYAWSIIIIIAIIIIIVIIIIFIIIYLIIYFRLFYDLFIYSRNCKIKKNVSNSNIRRF